MSSPCERGHPSEAALVHEVGRLQPVARREHSVARCGGAPALHVTEDGHARLEARALLDLAGELAADAPELDVAELVGLARLLADEPPLPGVVGELVALADDDDREVEPALVAAADLGARLLDGDRLLGDQDHVGAAGDPAHHRDPARCAGPSPRPPSRGCGTRPSCAAGRSPRSRSSPPCRSRRCSRLPRGRCRSSSARRRPGSPARGAAGRRRRACPRRRSRRARRARPRLKFASTRSTEFVLYGFVREVPMIVPPRGRIPEISRGPSGSISPSTSPFQPARTPSTSCPLANDLRPTARMTAFRPGQSPPPVSTPIRIASAYETDEECRRWESNPHGPRATGF